MTESEFLQLQNECRDARLPDLEDSNEARCVKVLDEAMMCTVSIQLIHFSVMFEGTPDQSVLV